MISTPVAHWPEHGPADQPPRQFTPWAGPASVSTTRARAKDVKPLPRHCHASGTLPPHYAHGQDGITTLWHTPWVGTQTVILTLKRNGRVPLPSRTLHTEWPDPNFCRQDQTPKPTSLLHSDSDCKAGPGPFSTGGPKTIVTDLLHSG